MKKIISLFLSLLLFSSLLTGCASTQTPTEESTETTESEETTETVATNSYNEGSYTASAYGNFSDVKIEVEFDQTEIKNIQVLEHNETPSLFDMVVEEIPSAIIENQSLAIDAVAGATNSAKAILEAVADCVTQAGGDVELLKNNKVEVVAGEDEEYTTDIVVVGAGASGFMAAINAVDNGANVIVLEKGSSVASVNGIKVSGPFAIDTPVLHDINSTLTVDDAFYHAMEYSHWTPNPTLIRKCLDTSKVAVEQLMGMGYEFIEANFRFETPFSGEKGGFHLITNPMEERVDIWEKEFANRDVNVMYNTSGEELIKTGDAITGIKATKADGTKVLINAKAVILATGGYLGNEEMLLKYLGTDNVNVASGGNSLCTGDGINMAIEVGASLDKTFGLCMSEYGGTNELASRPAKQDKYDQNYAFKFGVYGALLVDAQGERFMNEGMMCDFPMSFGSEPILRNSPYYAVVDSNYVEAMATEGLYNYTTARGATSENWFIGNYYKDKILTNIYEDLEEGIEEGWCYKAETIEELAEFFELENLPETVDQYNQYCADGYDPQFNAASWYLNSVSEGPYYITQNEVSAWSTFGGVTIDDDCRALTSDKEVINGLYVVGTDAGSLFYSPYYDIPGFCYGLSIDSGVIAGTDAARYVLE